MDEEKLFFRVSLLKEFPFPTTLEVDETHIYRRKRKFPWFWVIREQGLPLVKCAGVTIDIGLLFSKVTIEDTGGASVIVLNGMWNAKAKEVRKIIDTRQMKLTREKDVSRSEKRE